MTSYNYRHDEALETIARKVITKYDPALLKEPAPIPVDDIMERVYDLTLEFHIIRKNGRILGETIFEDTEIPIYEPHNNEGYKVIPVKAGTVIIDARLLDEGNDGRYRFTCAHELAHWVIDRKYFMQIGETAALTSETADVMRKSIAISSNTSAMIERQANRMASRILMPKCTLKPAYHHVRGTSLSPAAVPVHLANLYGVSKQAMQIRLEEMGLTI